jgi:hypothetical protein
MRGFSRAFLILGLAGWAAIASADDVPSAGATIEEAIRAHGGLDRLARTLSMTRIGKCEVEGLGKAVKATGEISVKLPGQYRWTVVLVDPKGNKSPANFGLSGDKGWRSSEGGAPKELSKRELQELRETAYVAWLATLAPLAQERTLELSALPPLTVAGHPAVGVKVTAKDRPEVKLYFDKTTHLLVKAEWKGVYDKLDALRELIYGDHKEFEGIKLATRETVLAEGAKVAEWTYGDFKFVDKFDESVFSRP